MARRTKEPSYFAGYIHDSPGPQGSILSVCCEGPDCVICAGDPEAAKRAGNRSFLGIAERSSDPTRGEELWSAEVEGHKIALDGNKLFTVTGPLFDDRRSFGSYREAVEAINQRQKQQAAQEREKLSIPVVDDDGVRRTITGVHAGHYGALGVGDARALYPPEDWIVETIKERAAARKRGNALDGLLSRYRIDPKPYGHSIRSHEEAVARIKRDAAEKTELASKGRP